jgi:hypothetical protein
LGNQGAFLMADKGTFRHLVAAMLVLLTVVFAVYWPGIFGDFIFDDVPNIVNNPSLRAFDGSLQSLIAAATSGNSSPLGRPLSMATFAINFYIFGDSPYSFKLTNLAIHIANAVLIFVLARLLSRRLSGDTDTVRSLLPVLWITSAWALHPINLTPVLFVVQRMTSLSALFMLTALTLYLHARSTKGATRVTAIALSLLLCWPAAVLSKETGLVLPIYIFLIEWLLLGAFRQISRKVKWTVVLATTCALIGVFCTKWDFITAGYAVRNFDLAERLLTEARVLWFYVRQVFLPTPEIFGLFHDDIAISRGLLTPSTTLLAIIAWLIAVGLALRQRARRPLFAFGVLWFLASHAMESSILPLEIAYEHRNYLAFFGVFVWLASLLFSESKISRWRIPRLCLAASFVLFCGLLTSLRSLQWGDEFQRSQIEVADHPASARANYQAAMVALQRTYESGGGSPFAHHMVQFYYHRAAELDPNAKAPLIGLLYLDCIAGLPKSAPNLASAREAFSTGQFTFGDRSMVQSLSKLLVENRLCLDDQEAINLVEAALANPTADTGVRGMLYAVAMDFAAAKKHDIPLALSYAQAAVTSDPGSVPLRVNLIHLYLQSGQAAQAKQEYLRLKAGTIPLRHQASVDEVKVAIDASERHANK